MTLSELTGAVTALTKETGLYLKSMLGNLQEGHIHAKGQMDFVTAVDKESEKRLVTGLTPLLPGAGFIAEEGTSSLKGDRFNWIIDPLDGTTNFIHGLPIYCVSIALAVKGKIEQAVVYDPTRNDLFTATKGRGAYMNNRRLRVAKRIRLQECLIATGFPYRVDDDVKFYLTMLGDVIQRSAGVRRPGAAALDLAYVAAGFTDGFFELGLQPWDVAAGSLLITEAGGLVGNLSGDANFLEQRECLAANPRIYGQLVALLGKYSKFASVTDKASVQALT